MRISENRITDLSFDLVRLLSNFFNLLVIFSPVHHHVVILLLQALDRFLTRDFLVLCMFLSPIEFDFRISELVIKTLELGSKTIQSQENKVVPLVSSAAHSSQWSSLPIDLVTALMPSVTIRGTPLRVRLFESAQYSLSHPSRVIKHTSPLNRQVYRLTVSM